MVDDAAPNPHEPDGPAHDADHRFVDTLLLHHFQDSDAECSNRIEAVLQEIDRWSESPASVRPARRWIGILGRVAAAIAVASLLLVPALLSNPAAAAIDRAKLAMSRLVDLHYKVEIETVVGVPLSGDMWFRGTDLVVIRLDNRAGDLWAGEGHDAAWVVPPVPALPVRVNSKGNLLEVLRIQNDLETPFLRISTLLARFGDSFEYTFAPDKKTVHAQRVAGAPQQLPDHLRVNIAADGTVRELSAEWQRMLGPRRFQLTWVDSMPKSASFYEHAAHHDASREVVDRR